MLKLNDPEWHVLFENWWGFLFDKTIVAAELIPFFTRFNFDGFKSFERSNHARLIEAALWDKRNEKFGAFFVEFSETYQGKREFRLRRLGVNSVPVRPSIHRSYADEILQFLRNNPCALKSSFYLTELMEALYSGGYKRSDRPGNFLKCLRGAAFLLDRNGFRLHINEGNRSRKIVWFTKKR